MIDEIAKIITNSSKLGIRFGHSADVEERDERFVRNGLVNKLDRGILVGDRLETVEDGRKERANGN